MAIIRFFSEVITKVNEYDKKYRTIWQIYILNINSNYYLLFGLY